MNTNNVIKKFKKIEHDFGIDCGTAVSTRELRSAVNYLLPVVGRIATNEQRSNIHNDHSGFFGSKMSSYCVVAGYCVHFLRKCLQYLQDRESSSRYQADENELLIRDLSFAYTAYWHLHDGYILGHGMDNEVACFEYESLFHFDGSRSLASTEGVDHLAIEIISEIANLYRDYYRTPWPPKQDRQPPLRKRKPDFKPWLMATNINGEWRLPNQPACNFFLTNNNYRQLIVGADLRIELDYENVFNQTNADDTVEMAGGQVNVTFKGKVLDLAPQSFSLVADVKSETLAVDYWATNRRKWLLDLYDEKLRSLRFTPSSVEQLDNILLVAQENILRFWISNHPMQTLGITDHCCIRQLHQIKKTAKQVFFQEEFHSRLPERFKTKAVCIAYLDLVPGLAESFIPEELQTDTELVHAIIKRMPHLETTDQQEKYANIAWGRLPKAATCEAQAQFSIEKSGAQAYGWLPSSLRTESVRRFAVENAPSCLDDLTTVFNNENERDRFLERTWPGIMEEIHHFECIDSSIKRSEAFRLFMDCSQANTLVEMPLPTFD